MISSIFSFIAGICITQYIILAVIIIKNKSNKNANIFLLLFLITNCICTYAFFSYSSGLYKYATFLIFNELPFYYLSFPLFFLYIKALTTYNFKLRKRDLLHFIVFFAVYIYNLPLLTAAKDLSILQVIITMNVKMSIHIIIQLFIALLYNMFYVIYSIIILNKYKNQIKNNYSNITKINLSWLVYLIITYIIVNIIMTISFTIISFTTIQYKNILQITTIINTLWIIALLYRASFQTQTLNGVKPVNEMKNNKDIQLKNEDVKKYIDKLNQAMIDEKLYLDPDLNLYDLSKIISISRNYLSQIINYKFKCNFYDFLNKYRVEEVKKYLSDPKYKDESILNIAFDSGFNSKSTFNRVFKEHTTFSPTEYKKFLEN